MAKFYPESINSLIDSISRLPGIGKRTAERLTLELYNWEADSVKSFAEQLRTLHELVQPCSKCGNFSAPSELCSICSDASRDPELICVVEGISQVGIIENSGSFKGLYHVIGGRLAPLDGVGPSDLNIASLVTRVRDEGIKEVILATSPDVEGEATASYLSEVLQADNLSISRIALGIPVGADLSYADSASMAMAINKRREF